MIHLYFHLRIAKGILQNICCKNGMLGRLDTFELSYFRKMQWQQIKQKGHPELLTKEITYALHSGKLPTRFIQTNANYIALHVFISTGTWVHPHHLPWQPLLGRCSFSSWPSKDFRPQPVVFPLKGISNMPSRAMGKHAQKAQLATACIGSLGWYI